MASRSLRGLGGPHVALGILGCESRVGVRVNSPAWNYWAAPLDGAPDRCGVAALPWGRRLETIRAEGMQGRPQQPGCLSLRG